MRSWHKKHQRIKCYYLQWNLCLAQNHVVKHLHIDIDKKFYNIPFKNLIQHYEINLYLSTSTLKASILKWFECTLGSKMRPRLFWKYKKMNTLRSPIFEILNSFFHWYCSFFALVKNICIWYSFKGKDFFWITNLNLKN